MTKESQGDPPRELTFKAISWECEDTKFSDNVKIYITGLSQDNETVQILVDDYTPYAYLELPENIKWTQTKCKAVFNYFRDVLSTTSEGGDVPLRYERDVRKNLYYADETLLLKFYFSTTRGCRNFFYKAGSKRGHYIPGVGRIGYGDFKVHEHNIEAVLKFTAARNLRLASWLKVTERSEPGSTIAERSFSTCKHSARVSWKAVEHYTPPKITLTKHTIFSFDLETYSENHVAKNPDPEVPGNVIMTNAISFCKLGDPEAKWEKYLISLFDPHDIPGVTIFRVADEAELIQKTAELIREKDPDTFYHYNGMKFDWNYLVIRAGKCGMLGELLDISRVIGQPSEVKTGSWSSSAYGEQNFKYVNPIGRTNVDVLIEIERNQAKEISYKLGDIAYKYLKETKDPLSPRQLFMLYDLTANLLEEVRTLPRGLLPPEVRRAYKLRIQKLLVRRWCNGPTLKLRTKLMQFGYGQELEDLVREAMTLIGTYNVRDTVLPILLAEKLGLSTTMEETSNTMHVPMSYLHTRGQQIKVLAQIYRDVIHSGFFIPYKDKNNAVIDPYLGALVQDPTPGNYDDVPIFDFESLYPCMIILMNICYTTLLRDGDPTPDSECNLVRRNEHRGCPHDHSGKKIKKDKVLCCDITYRFRKVVFLPDGTRLHEGVMPKLERNLMVERKAVKKEMAKYEAMVKSAMGTATDDDLAWYAKMGWFVVDPSGKPGILPVPHSISADELFILKTMVKVLNAKQLALKVSANSAYGALGAQKGFLPFVPGASSVTAMGRLLITEAINYILRTFPGVNANGFADWMKARLVYGDTDSCLIKFMHIVGREAFAHGLMVAARTTHYLRMWSMNLPEDYEVGSGVHRARLDKYGKTKLSEDDVFVGARSKAALELLSDEEKVLCHRYDYNPINLQFENLYSRLLMLSKKRYMTHTTNSKGEMAGKSKKGTVTARRDGSQFLRDIYNEFSESVLKKEPEVEVMYKLYNRVLALFTRQVPMANFVVVKGIKSVISYANKTPQGAYLMKDGKTTFHTEDPLDPRLVYKNLPHLNLALKIMRRGDEVLPNTRMEYVYIENLSAKTSSDQTEDYDYYRENKASEGFRIDHFFYLSSIENPMQELINVSYARPNVLYESLEAALERATSEADSTAMRTCLSLHVRSWIASSPRNKTPDLVGWAALAAEGVSVPVHRRAPARVYTTRRLAILKLNSILTSMRLSEANPDDRRYLAPTEHAELRNLVLRAKSKDLFARLKKQYHLGHIYEFRPQNRGEEIKLVIKEQRVKMMLTREIKHAKVKYPRETIVEMVASYRDGVDSKTIDFKAEKKARSKANHIWSYEVRLPSVGGVEGDVIHVERTDLAPFYLRDSRVIEQLYQAHKLKRKVNDDLIEVFS